MCVKSFYISSGVCSPNSHSLHCIDQKHMDSVGIDLHCIFTGFPLIFGSIVALKCQAETWLDKERASTAQQQVITTPPSITILIDFQLAIYIRELVLLPY